MIPFDAAPIKTTWSPLKIRKQWRKGRKSKIYFLTSFRNIRIFHSVCFIPCDSFQNVRLRSSGNFIRTSIIFNLKNEMFESRDRLINLSIANLLLESLELLWCCVQGNKLQSAIDSHRSWMRWRTIDHPLVIIEWFSIWIETKRKKIFLN